MYVKKLTLKLFHSSSLFAIAIVIIVIKNNAKTNFIVYVYKEAWIRLMLSKIIKI